MGLPISVSKSRLPKKSTAVDGGAVKSGGQ
jgi:hypothetical protein